MPAVPRVGVSSCLLGEAVRYDGADKRDGFIVDQLGPSVEWAPVCPEVGIGMPVPRPALHLSKHGDDVHLVEVRAGTDHTKAMLAFAAERMAAFRAERFHGFVFKARSPSCGIGDAPLTNEQGYESGVRSGVFADRMRKQWPELPVISEAMLMVPDQRERFLSRIFAGARLDAVSDGEALVAFHTAHDTLLASRSHDADDELMEAVLSGDAASYALAFGRAMRSIPSRRGHARALRAVMPDAPALEAIVVEYEAGKTTLAEAVIQVREALGEAGAANAYLHPHPLCFEAYADL